MTYLTHRDFNRATHADFMAKCAASRADDTPRLVYADWLEEWGEKHEWMPCERCDGGRWKLKCGWWSGPKMGPPALPRPGGPPRCDGSGRVPTGAAERAEFIRVQCELHRLPLDWRTLKRSQGETRESRMKRVAALGVCERKLLPLVTAMLPEQLRPPGLHYSPATVPLEWRRGFIHTVRGPLAALVGGVCVRCEGHGVTGSFIGDNTQVPVDYAEFDCPDCKGTGRTDGRLRRLGAELGLVELAEPTDVANEDYPVGSGIFSVWADDLLPASLFESMWAANAAARDDYNGMRVLQFHASDDVRDALSAAILVHARGAAGQPTPIPTE